MSRIFSLAHLTVIDLTPPEMIRVAAEVGYAAVGLRLIRVTDTSPSYPLMHDPVALRATRAALADTGLSVNDIEFVKLTPEFRADQLDDFLAAGAVLGARHVICAPYDPDLGRLAQNLAAFSARAQGFGLRVVLEFFPWTVVPDLASAISVVTAAADPAIGILVDALHFNRSGSRLADLAALPPDRLPFAHLCDAPVQPSYSIDELLHAGRAERLAPGDGDIPLRPLLAALPVDIPLALEVPMTAMRAAQGSAAVARHVLARAQALFK